MYGILYYVLSTAFDLLVIVKYYLVVPVDSTY